MRGPLRPMDWPLPSRGRVRGPFLPMLLALGLAGPKNPGRPDQSPLGFFSPGSSACSARLARLLSCNFSCFYLHLPGRFCVLRSTCGRLSEICCSPCPACLGVAPGEPPDLALGFCLFFDCAPCTSDPSLPSRDVPCQRPGPFCRAPLRSSWRCKQIGVYQNCTQNPRPGLHERQALPISSTS